MTYGTDRSRREIEDELAVLLELRRVLCVGFCGRRIEHEADLLVDIRLLKALQAFVCREYSESLGPRQSVGRRVYSDHRRHLERFAVPHHLDHQVGSDVSGPDNCDVHLGHLSASFITASEEGGLSFR